MLLPTTATLATALAVASASLVAPVEKRGSLISNLVNIVEELIAILILEIERSNDQYFWDSYVNGTEVTDEWHFCKTLGDQCGPVLEEHYSTYITTETIDKLAKVGVNFLRIPITYAAWVAISAVLEFIEASVNPWAYTVSVINEASDNPIGFATAADCFLGEEHWSPYFDVTDNLVIDTHIYYFAAAGVYSGYAVGAICGQASAAPGDAKFPVFIGEWSLQTLYNNTYDNREELFNTQRYAWSHYVQGGAFWGAVFNGTDPVDGEGTQRDYWDYTGLIDANVIHTMTNQTYC
ncbi:hypothetical protein D6C90_10130 [Aureobasidium pullulans]|uniref:glucan 1,3-beta-glucosidase n=1 Tax=Aureobasidium pullulans TaxID=5580 RepID=A0A4S9SV42_AURPU|nr:hypothetical protein D6C90_10130 [Aureobasidium pullulans]